MHLLGQTIFFAHFWKMGEGGVGFAFLYLGQGRNFFNCGNSFILSIFFVSHQNLKFESSFHSRIHSNNSTSNYFSFLHFTKKKDCIHLLLSKSRLCPQKSWDCIHLLLSKSRLCLQKRHLLPDLKLYFYR